MLVQEIKSQQLYTEANPKLFIATKAFVQHDGKILIIRESKAYAEGTNSGSFDIIGGRLTPGEKPLEALAREVKEETGLDVEIGKPFFVSEWRPVIKGEPCQIIGIFFECFAYSENIQLSEDHLEYKWIDPTQHTAEQLIPTLHSVFDMYNNK